jgi:hypothetical protein
MSALPWWFRPQLVQQSQAHRQPRCRDSAPRFRSLCGRARAERPANSPCSDRSAFPWSGAASGYQTPSGHPVAEEASILAACHCSIAPSAPGKQILTWSLAGLPQDIDHCATKDFAAAWGAFLIGGDAEAVPIAGRAEPARSARVSPATSSTRMAKKAKTALGRKQDRARVAGGQDYVVRYEAKKSGRSSKMVDRCQEGWQQPQAGGEAARSLTSLWWIIN